MVWEGVSGFHLGRHDVVIQLEWETTGECEKRITGSRWVKTLGRCWNHQLLKEDSHTLLDLII